MDPVFHKLLHLSRFERLVKCTEPFSTPNPDFPVSESSPLHMNRYLLATIRPFVYFVQGAVDPTFKGDAPYVSLSGAELAGVRKILIHLADDLVCPLYGNSSSADVVAPSFIWRIRRVQCGGLASGYPSRGFRQ